MAKLALATITFEQLVKFPCFNKFTPAKQSDLSFDFGTEWWDKAETEIEDQTLAEHLRQKMEEWPPTIQGQNASGTMMAAACELARYGVSGWPAVRLLELVESTDENGNDYPWEETELQHKVEDAYEATILDRTFGRGPVADEFDGLEEELDDAEEPPASEKIIEANTNEDAPDVISTALIQSLGGYIGTRIPSVMATAHYPDLIIVIGQFKCSQLGANWGSRGG